MKVTTHIPPFNFSNLYEDYYPSINETFFYTSKEINTEYTIGVWHIKQK